jgi:hypothetical protein
MIFASNHERFMITAFSMALTALDLGDVYMTVISSQNFTTTLRPLTLKEFWEVCSVVNHKLIFFRVNM